MSKHSLQVRARRAGIWPCLRCVAVLIGALLAGCGGGGGDEQKADYDPPRIVWARFEPSSLGDIGGTARIIALVTDTRRRGSGNSPARMGRGRSMT